jgi:ribose transport system permease protein
VLAVGGLLRDGFISRSNIQTILVIASFIGFVAAGQTFVILIGGIDFSVAWTLNARPSCSPPPRSARTAGRRTRCC